MRRHQLSILALARLLTRHVHARTHGRESGAVATLVAIMLGTGVILGCAALTIDTGSLLWERRQLQNGADAASLSAAQLCAGGAGACPTNTAAGSALATLASANASDNATAIESICYSSTAIAANSALAAYPCPAPGTPGQLVECPAVPSNLTSASYVEVRTKTLTTGGSTILPPYLAQTLAGGGYSGETVRACARAAWGNPGYSAVPVTFSYCEWQRATGYTTTPSPGNPGVYAANPVGAAPGYGGAGQPAWPAAAQNPPVPGQETIIYLQDHGSATGCANWNGHDTPGGFGYLTANGCLASVSADGWVQVDTGNSSPCDMSQWFHKIIYLPVFDCVMRSGTQPVGAPTLAQYTSSCDYGTGSNTWYHIQGFAKFYLSGYKTGGSQEMARTATGTVPCSNGDRCLSGWFLQGLVPVGGLGPPSPPGAPFLGAYAVQVAG